MIDFAQRQNTCQSEFAQLGFPKARHEDYTWVNVRQIPVLAELSVASYDFLSSTTLDWQALKEVPNSLGQGDALALRGIFSASQSFELVVPAGQHLGVVELDLPTGVVLLQIRLEEGASAEFVLKNQSTIQNQIFSWVLAAGAELKIREWNQSSFYHGYHHIELADSAQAHIVSAGVGSELSRTAWRIHLNGTQSDAKFRALALANGQNACHHHVQIFHHAPNSTSDQVIAQVLGDQAQASFDGTVVVDRIAQEINSAQIVRSLLLSENAKAHCKPNLQIHADNVKCSHGNTCGELEESELFYLQARGLAKSDAQNLLTLGFCEVVLEDLVGDQARAYLHQNISTQLTQMIGA